MFQSGPKMTNKTDKARLASKAAFANESCGYWGAAKGLWAVAAVRWEMVGRNDNAKMADQRRHHCSVMSMDDEEE